MSKQLCEETDIVMGTNKATEVAMKKIELNGGI